MGNPVFTAKQDSIIRRMWKEDATTRRIAEVLGSGINRNQVIGRAHRLGLSKRASPILGSKPGHKPRVLTPEQREKKRARDREAWRKNGAQPRPADWGLKAQEARERKAAAIIAPPPIAGSMSFSDAILGNKCMWAYGDLRAGGSVCGADRAKGSRSWCAGHSVTAVQGSKGATNEQPKEAADGVVA